MTNPDLGKDGTKMARQNQIQNPAVVPEIYVQMLGKFQIQMGDIVVQDDVSRSQKIWNLLAYFIVHRDRLIAQEELINLLWPDEEISNPANALKTLLFRVRAILTPAFGRQYPLILSRRGAYSWNPLLPCRLDTDTFETLAVQAADETLPEGTRMELYKQAIALYTGDFLPKLSGRLWVIPLATRYHALYVETVQSYGIMLMKAQSYAEAAALCNEAIQIEPYDETLYGLLISALMRQGKNIAALAQYERATDLLYRNLGVRPSQALRQVYQEIMKEQKSLETDLSLIQEDLQETASRTGAFVCEYGFFREAYRLEARRAARQGNCVHIALMTVSLPDGSIPSLDVLSIAMDKLLEVLKSSLRRGDVVSRYSGAQYVVMLPSANFEDGTRIMERIIKTFVQQNRRTYLKINYELRQLDLAEAGD